MRLHKSKTSSLMNYLHTCFLLVSLALPSSLGLIGKTASQTTASKPTAHASDFVNTLGMEFLKVGDLLFCKWEVRVRDYKPFAEEMDVNWSSPPFEQGETHPAVNVSWEDAVRFCRWLTNKELKEKKISGKASYRLPTSREWSMAAGLPADEIKSKKSRSFAWGEVWPPPRKAGNYGQDLGVDRFPNTAPVGSFSPNAKGIHDLGGNVWEWCSDNYENAIDFRVLRGASWRMRNASDLLLSNRIGNLSGLRLTTYGFRVLLQK